MGKGFCYVCCSKPPLALVNYREKGSGSVGEGNWLRLSPNQQASVLLSSGLQVLGNILVSTGMRAAYYTGSSGEWQVQR